MRFAVFSRNVTFQRQLGFAVAFGIVLLALISSAIISWQGNQRARADLIEQGVHITENLARQSSLALIFASADNVKDAVNTTLAFPGVIGLEICNSHGEILLRRGVQTQERKCLQKNAEPTAQLQYEDEQAWRFAASVYSQPEINEPFGDAPAKEFLGYVSVVVSKAVLAKMTKEIVLTNLTTSLSIALVLLFVLRLLTRSMTRPLEQLAQDMGRAERGENNVRAQLSGPKDIVNMAQAFNSMMAGQEEREAALRIAAIAFETEEGMIVTDEHAIIIKVNKAFTRLTGYSAEEAIGQRPSLLRSDKHGHKFYQEMWESLQKNNYWQGEIWNRDKQGEIHPQWLNITAVLNHAGQVTNYVGAYVDFTERKQAESEIHLLAFYDPLTRLPNRRLLLERLQRAVLMGTRNQTGGALLFIDLDNFKTLNDTKGHAMGDLLLIEVAQRLLQCVREGDTVARLGGDEFVLLLEGLSDDSNVAISQVQRVGEKVLNILSQPYYLGVTEFHSSSSIGVTLFIDYRDALDELLKQADTAMYEAKKSGRNAMRLFDPSMQEELENRALIELGLRDALRKQEFCLYYQMQINHRGEVKGAEALLRWTHPEKGIVSPQFFIPLAESSGLILPVGAWVLEQACRQLKRWEQSDLTSDLQLAVNVSVRQFREQNFVDQVHRIIQHNRINPERLKLELTESIVLDDVTDTIAKMLALKKMGVSFSMDDFGTGYSSLAYLTQLPLNQLKIDQSFVRHIGSHSADSTIVQTIIGMANNLGIEVIAEGVETQQQQEFLHKNGCHLYQGYLFSKPVPDDVFEASLLPGNKYFTPNISHTLH